MQSTLRLALVGFFATASAIKLAQADKEDDGMMMEGDMAMEDMAAAESMSGMAAEGDSAEADGDDCEKSGCCGGNNVSIDINFAVNVAPAAQAAAAEADSGAEAMSGEEMKEGEMMEGGETTTTTTTTTTSMSDSTSMDSMNNMDGMDNMDGMEMGGTSTEAVVTSVGTETSTAEAFSYVGAPDFICTKTTTQMMTDVDGNVTEMPPTTEDVDLQECCDEDPVEFEDACNAAGAGDIAGDIGL